ncbi:Uncharacterised protein [Klebsiella pneumoniae]|nr:Uncharacterised protein [Klebsiella pneumoniae]SSN22779.1 Uncharacterised protein [Klebsiella pneumoniae]
MSLHSSSSARVISVDSSASMVPRSHSRATTSEVSMAPTTVMMMVIAPGIIKCWLIAAGLNQ